MKRREYYSAAIKNLGTIPFLFFEYQKRAKYAAPFRLTSKKLNFPIQARPGTSDLGAFYQILVFDEYRCVADLKSPSLIVDLGANVGYSSAYFLSRFENCRVIAIEPDASNFRHLQSNVAAYGSRVTSIQAAIWPDADTVNLHKPMQGDEWGITVDPSTEGTIKTITIPEIMRIAGGDRISLLKIDIEGAEKQLFEADTSWLDSVDNIVIELHGEDCKSAFLSKIMPSQFVISRCDELTVCLSANAS